MIDYKKELNEEQYNVVTKGDGPCLVLAGAGSGKTRTVTYRVAYLIEQGVLPKEMLLLTFTNKAAKEMTMRVGELATTNGNALKLPWAGTFHGIAYKIMRQYGALLGYGKNFSILDSADSNDVMKLCIKQEGVDRTSRRYPSSKVMLSIISFARNAERTIEDVLDEKYPKWLDIADTITRVGEEYRKRKRLANAMDFDDLLVNLYILLLNAPKVKEKFSTQFKYIMVDEYQDTNKVQASIIKQFTGIHNNVLVVGDDAQSIYSFRAADIQNILQFKKTYQGAKIFRLETNYRSTPDILAVANNVISNNRNQYEKELRAIHEPFVKPEVHAFADYTEEAEFIANKILELRDEGIKIENIAVLFRAAFHAQALEMELTKRDIPYDFRGGVRFFARAHIKDVLAYLRIFSNRLDDIAWSRVLSLQRGIGAVTTQKICLAIREAGPDMPLADIDIKLSARAKIGWQDFLQIYEKMDVAVEKTPTGLIRAIVESKYVEYLESEYPDYRDRLQDINQLAIFSEKHKEVQQFLAEATLQEQYRTAGNNEPDERGGVEDEAPLILSTIHQAKGLEWNTVFVMHMAQGQFPNERALSEKQGIEEERRLFYVAVTRAKKQLYLSYPISTNRTMMLGGPSIFLEEINKRLIDEHHFGGGSVFFDEPRTTSVFKDPSDDIDDVIYIADDSDYAEASSDKDEPFPSKKPGGYLKNIF